MDSPSLTGYTPIDYNKIWTKNIESHSLTVKVNRTVLIPNKIQPLMSDEEDISTSHIIENNRMILGLSKQYHGSAINSNTGYHFLLKLVISG